MEGVKLVQQQRGQVLGGELSRAADLAREMLYSYCFVDWQSVAGGDSNQDEIFSREYMHTLEEALRNHYLKVKETTERGESLESGEAKLYSDLHKQANTFAVKALPVLQAEIAKIGMQNDHFDTTVLSHLICLAPLLQLAALAVKDLKRTEFYFADIRQSES